MMVGYTGQSQWVVGQHPQYHNQSRSRQKTHGKENNGTARHQGGIFIRRNQFRSINDVPRIKQELRAGHIVFLDAHDVLNGEDADYLQLKRAIAQLRGYCNLTGGTIGRIGQDLLVITPNPKVRLFS